MHAPVYHTALSDAHFVTDHLDRSVTDDEPMADYADRALHRIEEPPQWQLAPPTLL